MNRQVIEDYIKELPTKELTHPYGKDLDVYSHGGEMFVILEANRKPIRISLRCDKLLADTLKERYEEVMPGHKLNKDKWITIVLSGQLNESEIKDLILHSYNIVGQDSK